MGSSLICALKTPLSPAVCNNRAFLLGFRFPPSSPLKPYPKKPLYQRDVIKFPEWNESPELREKSGIWHKTGIMYSCRLELHLDYIFGTFKVPSKIKGGRDITFAIYITNQRIIILDDDGEAKDAAGKIAAGPLRKNYSPGRFIYDFLMLFIDGDLLFLEKIERDIAVIEEDVLEGRAEKFSYRMLYLKKLISRFYHYYIQLKVIAKEFAANENGFFNENDIKAFDMFQSKMEQLADETQMLREYAMQVQDVYQSEIEIKQNDVMKILTIVTTIFLPLTLIAGWYGMNFEHMPEIKYQYAYPVTIAASIIIVAASLYYFKKKKFW